MEKLFCMLQKATEDEESSYEFDEDVDLRTILIDTFPIYFKCSTISYHIFSSQKTWRKA